MLDGRLSLDDVLEELLDESRASGRGIDVAEERSAARVLELERVRPESTELGVELGWVARSRELELLERDVDDRVRSVDRVALEPTRDGREVEVLGCETVGREVEGREVDGVLGRVVVPRLGLVAREPEFDRTEPRDDEPPTLPREDEPREVEAEPREPEEPREL